MSGYTSQEQLLIQRRGFEKFESDEQMLAWLEEKGAFQQYGHKRRFIDFYISDYCLDRIYDYLTKAEVKHLRELQNRKRAEHKAAEDAREWRKVDTFHYADNSVEKIWIDKNGVRKTVTTVGPGGDVC